MSGDVHLRDLGKDWELRINLLSESAPAVEPPAHVWKRSPSGSGRTGPICESWLNRLWDSSVSWRGRAAPLPRPLPARAAEVHVAANIEPAARAAAGATIEATRPAPLAAGRIESRLSAVVPASSHMAVLLDKDRRPMMNADLDASPRAG